MSNPHKARVKWLKTRPLCSECEGGDNPSAVCPECEAFYAEQAEREVSNANPINFLTASGEELYAAFFEGRMTPTFALLAEFRDQTAAAAEAKVRGELEDKSTLALRTRILNFKLRAERAEAERDAAREMKERAERDLSTLLDQRADAKREGAYEALTKFAAHVKAELRLPSSSVGLTERFRDQHYAPTPARSVELVVHIRGTNGVDGITITPEQARAIVALAREDGNA